MRVRRKGHERGNAKVTVVVGTGIQENGKNAERGFERGRTGGKLATHEDSRGRTSGNERDKGNCYEGRGRGWRGVRL